MLVWVRRSPAALWVLRTSAQSHNHAEQVAKDTKSKRSRHGVGHRSIAHNLSRVVIRRSSVEHSIDAYQSLA